MNTTSVTIDRISHLLENNNIINNFSIDIPQDQHTKSGSYIDIAGWVIGTEKRVLSIEITNNDFALSRIQASLTRDDVSTQYPDNPHASTSGFHTQISTLGLPKSFEITIQAVLAGEDKNDRIRIPLATINGSHTGLVSSYTPKRQPLLITALGRSGTTWLMRLLSGNENIATVPKYPYETRLGVYWMHTLYVLSSPGNHAQSIQPDGFESNLFNSGSCPYFHPAYINGLDNNQGVDDWFANDYPADLADLYQASIDSYYDKICEPIADDITKYFMEKNLGGHIPWVYSNTYEQPKEIVLIRDFRDMFCSSRAFNEKRGFAAFGKQLVNNDEDWIKNRYRGANKLIAGWKARKNHSLLVRYEDLVVNPIQTLIEIFEYLEIDAHPEYAKQLLHIAKDDTQELRAHRTTNDPISSIGRWKHDMDEDTKQLFHSVFGEILNEFGYARTIIT